MRYQQYLRQRYRALLGYVGSLVGIIGIIHLIPLVVILFYPHEIQYAGAFIGVGISLMLVGYGAYRWLAPRDNINLSIQEAMVVVILVWLIALVASALPFMPTVGLNFSQAIFESTSGWTGTGLSVVIPEDMPRIILLHRSLTQLWGGAGFAIIALSAIASPLGAGFSMAEGRTDQLAPHVRRSASIVLSIYLGYIFFGILALRVAGMSWFDAVNHASTAVATGGFSTKNASIAHFDSFAIELVLMVLMVLGGINFLIAYTAFQGKWRAVFRSAELRLMALIILGAAASFFFLITSHLHSPDVALRHAFFEAISPLTSTGFNVATYAEWSDFGIALSALLMLLGGGIGSTSGGVKLLRVYILYKGIKWEIRRAFLPQHTVNEPHIWQGERRETLNDHLMRQVFVFMAAFTVVYLFGVGMMLAHGYGLRESVFEVASAIGTAGLSTGITQPNMPEVLLWSQSIVMLLGRLEFYAVFIGLAKLFQDLYQIAKRKPH